MPKNQDDEFWELLDRMEQAMPEEPPLPEEGAGAAGAFDDDFDDFADGPEEEDPMFYRN